MVILTIKCNAVNFGLFSLILPYAVLHSFLRPGPSTLGLFCFVFFIKTEITNYSVSVQGYKAQFITLHLHEWTLPICLKSWAKLLNFFYYV